MATTPNEQADSALAATPSPPIPISLPPFGSAVGSQSHQQTYQVSTLYSHFERVEPMPYGLSHTVEVEGNGDNVVRVQNYLVMVLNLYLSRYFFKLGQQASNSFVGALIGGNDTSSVTLTIPPAGTPPAPELIPDRKIKIAVASLLTTFATGAVIGVVSGLIGNEKAELTHRIIFKVFTALCYFCLVSSISMLLLVTMPPKVRALGKIVKLTTWIAVASFVYAIDCLACIQIQDKVGVIIALVVPLVLLSIITIFHFTHSYPFRVATM